MVTMNTMTTPEAFHRGHRVIVIIVAETVVVGVAICAISSAMTE
jgi:hypothetical protein